MPFVTSLNWRNYFLNYLRFSQVPFSDRHPRKSFLWWFDSLLIRSCYLTVAASQLFDLVPSVSFNLQKSPSVACLFVDSKHTASHPSFCCLCLLPSYRLSSLPSLLPPNPPPPSCLFLQCGWLGSHEMPPKDGPRVFLHWHHYSSHSTPWRSGGFRREKKVIPVHNTQMSDSSRLKSEVVKQSEREEAII